jgi:hypothetical protein
MKTLNILRDTIRVCLLRTSLEECKNNNEECRNSSEYSGKCNNEWKNSVAASVRWKKSVFEWRNSVNAMKSGNVGCRNIYVKWKNLDVRWKNNIRYNRISSNTRKI